MKTFHNQKHHTKQPLNDVDATGKPSAQHITHFHDKFRFGNGQKKNNYNKKKIFQNRENVEKELDTFEYYKNSKASSVERQMGCKEHLILCVLETNFNIFFCILLVPLESIIFINPALLFILYAI